MIKSILKNFASKKQLLFGLLLLVAVVAIAFTSLLTIDRPKALIIHAPQTSVSSNVAPISYEEPIQKEFRSISPASFSAIFGVAYKEIEIAKPTPKPEKKIVKKVKTKPRPPKKPKPINLRSLGYRLTGMITGEKETTIFLYDPIEKKNRVVRKNASDSIKIVSTWQRSVELITPKGQGIIELEHSKTIVRAAPSNSNSNSRNKSVSKPVESGAFKKDGPPQRRPRPVTAESMISKGDLRPSRVRGSRNFGLTVKSVPNALKDFSIQKGDVIIGSERSSFKSFKDANSTFSTMKERPTILKVKRGRKTLFLRNKTQMPESTPPKK